jgi:hypothetical protein
VNGQKVNRTIWSDVYTFEYQWGQRTATYVRVEHGSTDYDRGVALFDLDSIEGFVGFEWLFSDRTRLFREGYYGKTLVGGNRTGISPPSDSFGGGFIGARGNFTEKLTGVVKAGYEFFQFDKTGAAAGGTDSGSSPVVESTLSFLLTERTSLSFDYRRRQQVSPEFSRAAYVADELSLGASTRLGSSERLRLDATARFGNYEYKPSLLFTKRTDTVWGITTGATWLFTSWFSTRLEYNFSKLQSDLAALQQYTQNRISIVAGVGY